MCADIYTKAFTDADKWKLACWLISICDPKELKSLAKQSNEWHTTPPQSRGKTSSSTNPAASAGGTTKTFTVAGVSDNLGGDGRSPGAGARVAVPEQPLAEAGKKKPQELHELRIGHCFTYKEMTHNFLYNTIKKMFAKDINENEPQVTQLGYFVCPSQTYKSMEHQ